MTNDYSDENVARFLNGLQTSVMETWFPIDEEEDPNRCYTILEGVINTNIEKHIPKKKSRSQSSTLR
jgi:hypothetical protein